uniref:Alpha-macroglobulin-like TED domain-containing protein n=1 Tax=Sphenodon punctatus TaxID=8508 RepID=A0A8D0G6L6_SPHPU
SIAKATVFLSHSLQQETLGPYPVAIAAYALSLASDNQSAIDTADAHLRKLATRDGEDTVLYWEVGGQHRLRGEARPGHVPSASAITVEATSYGLLHLLLRNNITAAKKVAKWLTEQRNYGGG